MISIVLCSKWLTHSFASVILLLILCSVLFISASLFLNSSKSLVNTSWIFSILFPDPGSSSLSLSSLFWKVAYLYFCLVQVAQSCLTLWDPMDCNSPGSSFHGILQARILEWVASHSLLQGIFSTQDWTQVSCIAGGFFTGWARREALRYQGNQC